MKLCESLSNPLQRDREQNVFDLHHFMGDGQFNVTKDTISTEPPFLFLLPQMMLIKDSLHVR